MKANAWRHAVPIILYQYGTTGEAPWDCTPGLACLVESQRVVIRGEVEPPLGAKVALHFACSQLHDGALVLVGTVRRKYLYRLGDGLVMAFGVCVQDVIDEPGMATLLGPERVATVAH